MDSILRRCSRCNEEKTLFDFSYSTRLGRYKNYCKKCRTKHSKRKDALTLAKYDINTGFKLNKKKRKNSG